MKELNSDFVQEKNKQVQKPFIRLFTLFDYDGQGNNLNYAHYPEGDITESSV